MNHIAGALRGAILIALTQALTPGNLDAQVVQGTEDDPSAAAGRILPNADSASRARGIDSLLARARRDGGVLKEDSSVTFLYRGNAGHVYIAGDPDGWDPAAGEMQRVPGTDLFVRRWHADPAARFEYKFVVDSTWILDPLNPLTAAGGFGDNSEVRMPRYRFPVETLARGGIPHGSIDTTSFTSTQLARRIPLYVYLPPRYRDTAERYPVLYVTDGGEYLSRTGMNNVIDNLMADGEITPLIAVFVDPRSDPADPRTNARMSDYALSDRFVRAVCRELRPLVIRRYRALEGPRNTAIMGASMGGLIATYAAFTQPGIFGLCAAQSPSYQWRNDTLITMLRSVQRRDFRMYLCTGTIHDAEDRSRIVRDVMTAKGYRITYREYPESHNWLNWSGGLADILRTFWGTR
jgi:enterochelin esterase family protein